MFSSLQPLSPGQRLQGGRYTVDARLDSGGMGAIYKAIEETPAFSREVVLKVMLNAFDPSDPQAHKARAQFLAEAGTLAKLNHDHIGRIHSFFIENDTPVIVMEYIPGQSLDKYLSSEEQGRQGSSFPERLVLRWGIVLCEVLEYLSAQTPQVIHHDIKPANIILQKQKLRLVDFGSAKIRPAAGVGSYNYTSLFGTPGYAAPEQYRSQSEPRSDVYALAATLYHLVTDQPPPITGITLVQTESLGAFGTALARALEHDVQKRPTASELKALLQELLPKPPGILRAPDGMELRNELELAKWCTDHWDHAAKWLSKDLSERIRLHWQKDQLADELKRIFYSAPNPDLALDAAIALLDPQGFGVITPRLEGNQQTIDFGGLAVNGRKELALTLSNPGPRHVYQTLQLPGWVTADADGVELKPGKRLKIILTADMTKVAIGGGLKRKLELPGYSPVLQAHVSLWRTNLSRISRGSANATRRAARGAAAFGQLIGAGATLLRDGLGVVLTKLLRDGLGAILTNSWLWHLLALAALGGLVGGLTGLICWSLLGFLAALFPDMIVGGLVGWAAEVGRGLLSSISADLELDRPLIFNALALGIGMSGVYASAGGVIALPLILSRHPFAGVFQAAGPGAGCGCLLGVPVSMLFWSGAAVLAFFGGEFMSGNTWLHIILIMSLACAAVIALFAARST